jgi:hypothetical protein
MVLLSCSGRLRANPRNTVDGKRRTIRTKKMICCYLFVMSFGPSNPDNVRAIIFSASELTYNV